MAAKDLESIGPYGPLCPAGQDSYAPHHSIDDLPGQHTSCPVRQPYRLSVSLNGYGDHDPFSDGLFFGWLEYVLA